MKIGVILITYNNENEILHTINSVKNQSFTDWKCVIVDNGSTDSTRDIIAKTVSGDSRFEVFHKTNEGPSAGRNFGFERIKSNIEYVHFLDGDDMLYPEFMTKMIAYLDEHPEVGLLGCHYEKIDEQGKHLEYTYRSRFKPGFLGFPTNLKPQIIKTPFVSFFSATGQGPFAVFRKSVFVKTSGYEETYWAHEDSDIFCQMSLLSEVHYYPEFLYKLRVRKNSLSIINEKTSMGGEFRLKWDIYIADTDEKNATIQSAFKYYYTRHKPLRDFKIAMLAMRLFFKGEGKKEIVWSLSLFKEGIMDLFFQKSYRTKNKLRKQAYLEDVQNHQILKKVTT